jgi:hypothetical protein
MVNVYLFIELLGSADVGAALNALKALEMEKCQFANVVALSEDRLVGQLGCDDSPDTEKSVFNNIAKVDGVVQTNVIAVVRPRDGG